MLLPSEVLLQLESVIDYWFGVGEDRASPDYHFRGFLWWRATVDDDQHITDTYSSLLHQLRSLLQADGVEAVAEAIEKVNVSLLTALCVVLDQFPRHIYRGTADALQFDSLAVELVRWIIKKKLDMQMSTPERLFVYVVLEHSESLLDVNMAVAKLEYLSSQCSKSHHSRITSRVRSAKNHREILAKFGRYCYRNELLGRESTLQEIAFLKTCKYPFVMKFMGTTSTSRSNDFDEKKDQISFNNLTLLAPRKLKVLVLHSFRQNAKLLKTRMTKLRTAVKDIADLVFISAPLQYQPLEDSRDAALQVYGEVPVVDLQRVWWTAPNDNSVYNGVQESLDFVDEVFAKEGPFDGVIGFSQGGAFGSLLVAKKPFGNVDFKFFINISGFVPRSPDLRALYGREMFDIPSLHVLGESDILVDPERTLELSQCFKNSVLLKHEGGHFVPNKWPTEQLVQFIAKFSDVIDPHASSKASFIKEMCLRSEHEYSQTESPASMASKLSFMERFSSTLAAHVLFPCGLSAEANEFCANSEVWSRYFLLESTHLASLVRDKNPLPAFDREFSSFFKDLCANHKSDSLIIALSVSSMVEFVSKSVSKHEKSFGAYVFSVFIVSWSSLYGALSVPPFFADNYPFVWDAFSLAAELNHISYQINDVHDAIIRVIAQQLDKDAAFLSRGQSHSQFALFAPRMNDHSDRVCRLAKSVARHLFPLVEPSEVDRKQAESDPNFDLWAYSKGQTYLQYRRLLSTLCRSLRPKKEDEKVEIEPVVPCMDPPSFSEAVLFPGPMPVVACDPAELKPLFSFLQRNVEIREPVEFDRGTVTPDGRLDLCKEAVGVAGIKGLVNSLQFNDHVHALLLGNNIVGDEGAEAIAEYVSSPGYQCR
eukprot:TRINITY_DN18306_c0_g1_i1.p1 TRINITY_DN18306_c0_g1~~TRINITY_DN18306_c0_g1_i1.p1  ORF type:complete len:878 (+),score=207.39 TRINITY_DN18306_c0_g1_i1:89-2722(+)